MHQDIYEMSLLLTLFTTAAIHTAADDHQDHCKNKSEDDACDDPRTDAKSFCGGGDGITDTHGRPVDYGPGSRHTGRHGHGSLRRMDRCATHRKCMGGSEEK